MLNGFSPQTDPLNDYEREVLLPVFCRCLRNKIGKASAITNADITRAMRRAKYQLDEARVRKIINHIRTHGLVRWLVATNRGYYIAETRDEVERYIESLQGREDAIRVVREAMESQLQC